MLIISLVKEVFSFSIFSHYDICFFSLFKKFLTITPFSHSHSFHQVRDVDKPCRDFTSQDCRNRWHKLFPSEEDANMTVNFLRKLKTKWPGLQFSPKLDRGERTNKPPVLTSLHIVWPWTTYMLSKLATSLFCDATYEVTVFNYKVVSVTTLDGNKQHRPLMMSFILSTTAEQWCIIFDILHKFGGDLKLEIYVVTSDQEKAISAGLRLSTLSELLLHFLCSLHVKWNVRDHK